jgi:3'(2'), 5'-bisphosphate nucleotidase
LEAISHLLETARQAILEAGKTVMDVYKSAEYTTEMKTGEMPVTTADKRSNTVITKYLETTKLPVLSEEGMQLDFRERNNWAYFWLIDPLDGTKEFINKNGEFTINIALVLKNKPVAGMIYAPSRDTLYTGSEDGGLLKYENGSKIELTPLTERLRFSDLLNKDTITVVASRSHLSVETMAFIKQFSHITLTTMGSSLKFMLLLENRADVYPRLGRTMEWDTAAAHAILNVSNRGIYQMDLQSELSYNEPDLANPFFVAF